MARKKKRRGQRGRGLSGIGRLLGILLKGAWHLLPWAILMALIVMLVLGVRKALFVDENLLIRRVEVQPGDAIVPELYQKLQSNLIGKNILSVDLKKIAHDLEINPEVRQAQVIRQFPSILKIDIIKRKPAAFVQLSTKGYFGVVSDDGVVLDVIEKRNDSLVLVQDFEMGKQNMVLGKKMKLPGFENAMNFMKLFWQQPLAQSEAVTKLSLDHLDNVSITLGSGPDIRLGRHPTDRIKALEKLPPILNSYKRDTIEYIDLQFDDVIVKKKSKG